MTPDGVVTWSTPANVDHMAWGCPTAVGDTQGNTYLQTIDTQGKFVLQSVDASGRLRWSTPLGDFSPWGENPVIGANGNVYLVERDTTANPYLFGYDTTTGAVTLHGISFPYVTGLYAYSGGLAIVNTDAGGIFGLDSEVDYLSYDGTLIHKFDTGAPISYNGNFSNAGGANGSVYVAGYPLTCSGGAGYGSQGLTNLSVEKITPAGLAWTWTDSTAHNCSATKLAATPDGGVILARNEHPPNPAADFTSISPTGALRWAHHAGGPLGPAYNGGDFTPVADSNGVVALPSSYEFACPDYSTLACSGVQVEFVTQDATSPVLPTLHVTDLANQYFNLSDLSIDAGRVYLTRSDAPVDNGGSLSAFAVTGLSTDYRVARQEALAGMAIGPGPPADLLLGSGGSAAPTPHASGTGVYVALGDSYSSGEGDPPYLTGTDTSGCHRSALSYAFRVNLDLGFYTPRFSFHACSGAKILDFYQPNRNRHEPKQLQWLNSAAQLVTLTIGGNDANFSSVLRSCFLNATGIIERSCTVSWNKSVDDAIQRMAKSSVGNVESLTQLYKTLLAAAPNAQVMVVGYPRFFPQKPPHTCGTGVSPFVFRRVQMNWINQKIMAIDKTIRNTVALLQSSRVKYVDAYSAFHGHERCTKDPYLNGIIPSYQRHIAVGSFHPNISGHRKLAKLVEVAYLR
jgi:hypothetical protein